MIENKIYWRPGDDPKGMHIITLYQPWASFILFGWKTIETRNHNLFSGLKNIRIGIHAGREYDYKAHLTFKRYLSSPRKEVFLNVRRNISNTMLGKILCTVYVSDVRPLNNRDSKQALTNCKKENNLVGLILKDMIPIEPAIPAKGKQGIWIYK